MTLSDLETAVRQDLNDTDAANYRWPPAIIDRCIARALKEYSFVWPRLQGIVVPLAAGVRAYLLPAPSTLSVPAAPVLTALPAGGSLPAGLISVKLSAAVGSTETAPSAESSIVVAAGGSISVQIGAIAGAQAYNVYVGSAPGAEIWNGRAGAGSVGAGLVDRGSGVPGGPLAGCHGALRGAEWRVRAERGQQPRAGRRL